MINVVGIVGMGLIGGSMAKSAKLCSNKTVYGFDIDNNVLKNAKEQNIIDDVLTCENMDKCDIVFICLYPKQIVEFIKNNISNFKKGSIISDVCGVKEYISDEIFNICKENQLLYIGTHPMAGKEVGGYENSDELLFKKASMIIATENKNEHTQQMERMFFEMGFKKVCYANPKKHDEIIAYTSQLAHVVSSSFVKSDTAQNFCGFSAGSFGDLTRVAKLNPTMWTQLFMANRKPLAKEIDEIIKHLTDYKQAISNGDEEKLFNLLYDGNKIKEALNDGANYKW